MSTWDFRILQQHNIVEDGILKGVDLSRFGIYLVELEDNEIIGLIDEPVLWNTSLDNLLDDIDAIKKCTGYGVLSYDLLMEKLGNE